MNGEVIRMSERKAPTITPCQSRIGGPFLGCEAPHLRCGKVEGHEGPHVFHVEWTDESA